MRDIYSAIDKNEARARMESVVKRFSSKASKFCEWLQNNFEEGLTYYRFPRHHWKKIRTVNVVERLNREVKRRTRVACIFPHEASCLRLVGSIAIDIHEDWISDRKRYMAMEEDDML